MRKILCRCAAGILLLITSFTAAAAEDADVKTKVTTGGASAADIISYQGPKARIAVSSFEVKAGKAWGSIGDGMQEMLIDSLFKTNRFIVLEKAALQDLQGEFELGSSGWSTNAPAKGTFETADIILTGAITAFEPDYKKRGGGGFVIPLPLKIGGGLKIEKKEAYIAASIRLVDVRTRRIIKTGTVEGYSSSSSLGILGGGLIGSVALGAGYESYKNTPMEKAVMIMLENAISEIVASVPSDYYMYTAEGKPVAAQETVTKSLGIVGGQDRFTAGEQQVFSEDFGKYNIGELPSGWMASNAQAEIALYDGKKWLRFLKDGLIKKEIKTSGDCSLEMTLFAPDKQTAVSVKYAGMPEILIEKGSVKVGATAAGEINYGTGLHKLEISKKGEQTVFFIDGKRVYTAAIEGANPGSLTILVKGIATNQGKELLLTDIKISEYK